VNGTTTPTLSATLAADYEALKNDLREANEMTAALQRELAGKSNEFALLRQVFEKTRSDLEKLQSGIGALRAERHGLANDLMRTGALEEDLAAVTAERDGLRNILEKRQIQIRELTVKLNQAVAALAEAQRRRRDPKWLG
jgi:chromosome segregation ATPase